MTALPVEQVSFSKLAKFARCGEAWRRRYVNGEKDEGNLVTVAGTAFHDAAAKWERGSRKFDLLETARESLIALPTAGVRYFGRQDVTWFLDKGLPQMVEAYIAHRDAELAEGFRWFADDPAQSIETHLQVKIADDLPEVVGYVDQVYYDSTGVLVIRELKSGEDKPEHRIQLNMYLAAWNAQHPEHRASYGVALYVKGGKSKTAVALPAPAESLERVIRDFVASVNGGIFPAFGVFTDACWTCMYRDDCPAAPLLSESTAIL